MKHKILKTLIFLVIGLVLSSIASAQVYGDGSDGDIIRSSSGSESGIIEAETYTIDSGVTRTVSGSTVIHATEKITIDGTLESTSENAGNGGSPTNNGDNGNSGTYIGGGGSGGSTGSDSGDGNGEEGNEYGGAGGGGYGACNGGGPGGAGGNGASNIDSIPSETQTDSISGSEYLGDRAGWSELYDLPSDVGAGGGGGGGGGTPESGSATKDGGKGGDGGGMIILVAPEIEIEGELYSRGEDGTDGDKADDSADCGGAGGGGGGGGGSGGLVYTVSETLTEKGTLSVAGGNGGIAPTDEGWAHQGADGAAGDSGEIYRVDAPTNEEPDTPYNPAPNVNEDNVSTSPDLEVDASDPDGDDMNMTFYDDSDNSKIGTDNNVSSGSTASVQASEFDQTGTTYDWYVVANDGEKTTQSSTWNFTTIHEPNAPNNPSPSDETQDMDTSEDLQADVSHPDGLDMDVTFRINDGSGWSAVDTDNNVADGGAASASPDLDLSGSYDWRAEASASGYSTESSTWSFSTEHDTSATLTGPSEDPSPVNPGLEASISHSDSSEDLAVEFVNDENGDILHTVNNVNEGDMVSYDPSGDSFASNTGSTYDWRVELSGDQASESFTSNSQNFTTVSAPSVALNSPSDGAENVGADSSLIADVSQTEDLELNTKIYVEYENGTFVDDYSVNSGSGEVNFSDPDLQLSEDYRWYSNTNITDTSYSQSDTSGSRTFSTEHGFRVDGAYPSKGGEAAGLNDTIDVEVFHSSDRSIDVEFYFNDAASGTPNVTKTVTPSGSAVNATVDTDNFDGFGEETGTTYNWSYVVSDEAPDTSNITSEGLNFTTVYRPELSLVSPTEGETNVDIDGGLDIGIQQDDNLDASVTAQLNNVSGSEVGTAASSDIAGTGDGASALFSLDNFDFVEAGETYSYNATGIINNPGDAATIRGSTGLNTFTVSDKPEVTSIGPADGDIGVDANPSLDATVDHEGNDQVTVEFYDWEKTGSEAYLGEETVDSGETTSVRIDDEDIGENAETYRWYVNVTTGSGTSWNNSADPYEFAVSSIGSVTYEADTESGVNLNPGTASDQGLDRIIGQENIGFEISNGAGVDMPGIAFNVSNGTDSEVFGELDDVESGSSVTVDLGDSSLIEEDQEGYELYAFYQESGTDFTGGGFRSDNVMFSTHVAEVEWVNPGQPGSQSINEYRVYYNNQSGQSFNNFDYVGSISDDDSGSFTVGVANLDLGEATSNECFRIVSWNVAGESDPTTEQCIGVIP